MKLLFLCTTEFQLITALNIKYHMHPDDDADIIVDNYHGEEKALAERIRGTNLFRKVFYVRSYIEQETLHKYFRSISDGEPGIGLAYAIKNSLLFLKMRIMTKVFGSDAYVNNVLVPSDSFSIEEYDAFFSYGDKPITCNIVDCILKRNRHCQFILLDEGIGTYTVLNLGKHSEIVDKCYVYDPDLVVHNKEACKIPSIRKSDKEFIDILNYVFQFYIDDIEDYSNSVIVFHEDGRDKMPKYLQNASWWVKILFHNPYRRHLEEDAEYNRQAGITNMAIDCVTGKIQADKIWIKLSPRAVRSSLKEFGCRQDIKIIRRYDLPWELVALNCSVKNAVLLANYSTAVALYNAVVDNAEDAVRCVLLYKIVHEFSVGGAYDCMFERIINKYGKVYAPHNINELAQ